MFLESGEPDLMRSVERLGDSDGRATHQSRRERCWAAPFRRRRTVSEPATEKGALDGPPWSRSSTATFEHHEYFPTGEVWVDEKSTVFRTPHQYGGGYVDEVRKILSVGARFYDQNREFFYSPDPILTMDPNAMVGDYRLRAAYSYSGSNPLTFVDPSGLQFGSVHVMFTTASKERVAADAKAMRGILAARPQMRAALPGAVQSKLPKSLVKMGLDWEKNEKRLDLAKRFETKPLIEVNWSKKTVKFAALYGKRLKLGGDKGNNAANNGGANGAANGGTNPPGNAVPGNNAVPGPQGANATGNNGGPNTGVAPPGPNNPQPNNGPRPPIPAKPLPPIPRKAPQKPLPPIPQGRGGTGSTSVNNPSN